MSNPVDARIGIALGSGSARGWAHIGVLRALTDMGIRPGIVPAVPLALLWELLMPVISWMPWSVG